MSDRKYRHRGYQDDDRDDRERRPPAPRTDPLTRTRVDGAPRGRGLGSPGEAVFKCAVCGRKAALGTVAPDSRCAGCGKPLHSCTNCAFFDTGARFECRKPIAARVESKVKANECTFFQPKTVRELGQAEPARPPDARAAFDALFKK